MLIQFLLNLLFPPKCVFCGKILERHQTDFCESCRVEIPMCPKPRETRTFLDSWLAVWYYEGNIRESLLRFKFRGHRHYAAAYGRMLALRIREDGPEQIDILTWVPISRQRKLERGYDQVQVLAKAVGRELGVKPVATLRKIRNNPPQSGITKEEERRANVFGVYRCIHPEQLQNKRILLLDDIITTGATAGECARVLKTAGAKQVHCGTVAAAKHYK